MGEWWDARGVLKKDSACLTLNAAAWTDVRAGGGG